VLSGPAIKRIEDSPLQQLVVSDSLPTPSGKQSDKIRTLSLAPMLADAITRIHTGQSVGAMFH